MVMLPESDQFRSLRTAVADIPSKNWAFTLKKGDTCLFFFPVNQFFYPASIYLVEQITRSQLCNMSVGFGYLQLRSVNRVRSVNCTALIQGRNVLIKGH